MGGALCSQCPLWLVAFKRIIAFIYRRIQNDRTEHKDTQRCQDTEQSGIEVVW